jgi:cell cycle related kinase
MDEYVVLGRVGEGAHGVVMKGRHKKSGSIVALKKILLKRLEDGIPETALREIKALQVLSMKSDCMHVRLLWPSRLSESSAEL